ncbi:MAG: hypothetical protein XU15_C0008G0083 [candidate division NC10 bacterium CSP1-5]|nr:MAG: hypothetical protein XU15_C0008G0083 [candidate division NC10 bacterium CSP1-5]
MPRKSRILRLSVPRGLGKEFEALAKEVGKSKGELLREMVLSTRRDRTKKSSFGSSAGFPAN